MTFMYQDIRCVLCRKWKSEREKKRKSARKEKDEQRTMWPSFNATGAYNIYVY